MTDRRAHIADILDGILTDISLDLDAGMPADQRAEITAMLAGISLDLDGSVPVAQLTVETLTAMPIGIAALLNDLPANPECQLPDGLDIRMPADLYLQPATTPSAVQVDSCDAKFAIACDHD